MSLSLHFGTNNSDVLIVQYTPSARSIRYVRHSLHKTKWSVKHRLHSFSGLQATYGYQQAERATIKCCREFSIKYNELLYCISLRPQQNSLQYVFRAISKWKRGNHNTRCEKSTIRNSSHTVTKKERLKMFTNVVKAQHLGRSDSCTKIKAGVRSVVIIPFPSPKSADE